VHHGYYHALEHSDVNGVAEFSANIGATIAIIFNSVAQGYSKVEENGGKIYHAQSTNNFLCPTFC
jgi:hypothetical protein